MHEQHIENEPATAKPASRERKRTVDPWLQWGIVPRIVFASLTTEAGLRSYTAGDRLGKKKHGWFTARDLVDQDPNLTVKSALRGMHECSDRGFMILRRSDLSSTAAFHACIAYNSGRGVATERGDPWFDDLGPSVVGLFDPDTHEKPERKRAAPKKATVTDDKGNALDVIVPDPQPACSSTTRAGLPCRSRAKKGADLCVRHLGLLRAVTVPPTQKLCGGTPLPPISELPTPPPQKSDAGKRTNCAHQSLEPAHELCGGSLPTGCLEGRNGETTDNQTALPTRVATETETLVPVGDGRSAVRGTGELLEGQSVSNLSDAEFTDDRPPLGKPLGYQRYDYISPTYRRPICAACGLPTIGEPDDDICPGTKCRIASKQRGQAA